MASNSEWRWKGKVAVVTGASAGIGEAIALQLADKGMIVCALGRRKEKLQTLLKRTSGTIHPLKCDVTIESEVVDTFAWIEKHLGGIDVLINNAGTFVYAPLMTGDTKDWKSMIDLNILSLSICCREALKTMRSRGDDGQIININSTAGHDMHIIPSGGMYSGSKFAVTSMSEGLQCELRDAGSEIKVSSVSPGLVWTELIEKATNYTKEAPHIDAEDIAQSIIYILSAKPKVRISELTIQHY